MSAFETPQFCEMVVAKVEDFLLTGLGGETVVSVGHKNELEVRFDRSIMRLTICNIRMALDNSDYEARMVFGIEKLALAHSYSLMYRTTNAKMLDKLSAFKYTVSRDRGLALKSHDNLKKDWPELVNEVTQ